MLIWCITLFVLGILAFLDTIFNYGDIFRRVNSVLFMLLSLGLLIRTRMLMKFQKIEKLEARNAELESQMAQLNRSPITKEKVSETVY